MHRILACTRAAHRGLRPLGWTIALTALCLTRLAASAHAHEVEAPLPGSATPTLATAPTEATDTAALGLGILGAASGQRTSAFATDSKGGRSSADPTLATRLRVRLTGTTSTQGKGWTVDGALAGDLVDGTVVGRTAAKAGDKLPDGRLETMLPQEAWLGLHYGRQVGMQVGVMTSQWGLGLVANDGGQGLTTDRNPWFTAGRSGDRVARAMVYGMPLSTTDSALRGWLVSLALDKVLDDDTASRALGQNASQVVAATKLMLDKKRWVGLYAARRNQQHDDGKTLDVTVIDAAADLDWRDEAKQGLRLQGELAWITGETTLAPTPDFAKHTVSQLGGLLQATHTGLIPGLTLQLDTGYFSGDANFDDGKLTAFRADRNLRQGLVLFERVLAWQTGQSRRLASNPELVGKPAEDLDRLASDGAVFNAITVYPKAGYELGNLGPVALQIYGGVLLALAPTAPTEPYATRMNGGYPRNFLGATPDGRWLGSELDVGLRAQLPLAERTRTALQLALEYGVLLPGGALRAQDGSTDSIQATRLTFSLLGR